MPKLRKKKGEWLRRSHKEYVKLLSLNHPGWEVCELYQGVNTKIRHLCENGHVVHKTPKLILSTGGCSDCRSRNKTQQEYERQLKKEGCGWKVLEPYQGRRVPILHQCSKGHTYKKTPRSCLEKAVDGSNGCRICSGGVVTQEDALKKLRAANPHIRVLTPYVNSITSITVIDQRCQHTYSITPSSIVRQRAKKYSCKICRNKASGVAFGNVKKTSETFERELLVLHPTATLLSKYTGCWNKVKVTDCCGHVWRTTPRLILSGCWCPFCAETLPNQHWSELYFHLKPWKKDIPATLYFLEFKDQNTFRKIGITTRSVAKRFPELSYATLQTLPMRLYDAWKIEQHIIKTFNKYKYVPKVLKNNGSSECFTRELTLEMVNKEIERKFLRLTTLRYV